MPAGGDRSGSPGTRTHQPLVDLPASPALSQVGGSFPADGRTVGIVVDDDSDATAIDAMVAAIRGEGLVPLVIGPHGGTLANGIPVQRTFGACRSVEFDAVIVAARPAPAPDAVPTTDAKGGEPTAAPIDPRVVLLLHECFRHAKAIGAFGVGAEALADADIPAAAAGIVTASSGGDTWSQVHELMTAAPGLGPVRHGGAARRVTYHDTSEARHLASTERASTGHSGVWSRGAGTGWLRR